MLTAKISGAILIITATALLGFLYSQEMKKRVENLYEIRKILAMLQGEMKYHKVPVAEVFRGMETHVSVEFQEFFIRSAEKLEESFGKTIQEIWLECCNLFLKDISLWKEDRLEFQRLGEILGYLDVATQSAGLEVYGQKLGLRIQQCSQELESRQRLIRCLGIAGGILVVIFFI